MPSTQPTQRAQEYWACLALRHTDRLGPKTGKKLIHAYGSAQEAVSMAGSWTRDHLVRPSVADIFLQEKWRDPALQEWELVRRRQDGVLLYTDPDYPESLRQIPDPPLYAYLSGDRSLLRNPGVAIVGARMCSSYGQAMARNLASGLGQAGVTVVSGFAMGIDRQAHIGALRHPGRSIAVLGTGLDMIYPPQNKDLWQQLHHQGLIFSEFAPGNEPDAHNFPRRNRIISGLSLGVVVVEAAQKSGSLITARLALEHNREVFAVPGQATTPSFAGCLELLRQGAVLTRSAQDILQELAPQLAERQGASQRHHTTQTRPESSAHQRPPDLDHLAAEERDLARLLFHDSQVHIDTLTQQLGWESQKVSQILLMLELKGVVRQQNGMYYALV
ncbi:MAG: DNA-processing protein DprA [Desulfovermiculus sp.]|nr:DNA-processing protein DprA [Desulfovermiculus sp.]